MREEYVGPEVSHAIHARAKRKCECENIRCKHVAGQCRNGLDARSEISLPADATTDEEKIAKGRAVCHECFQRSDSLYRRRPSVVADPHSSAWFRRRSASNARSGHHRHSRPADPPGSRTPASEESRPPSNAAVNFRRAMAGKAKVIGISCAASDAHKMVSTPIPYAASTPCATPGSSIPSFSRVR
jgi:hypothetical protein